MKRRLLALAATTVSAFAGLAMLTAPAASAHPLGNFTVNRYGGLVLSPGHVTVTYVLDMAEIPTYQEMPSIDRDGDGTASAAERQAWADRTAPSILRGLTLTVGGRPVGLVVRSASMRFRDGQGGLPIVYFRAAFAGSLPGSGDFRYEDRNDPGRIGWREVTASSLDGVAISGSSVPTQSLSHELTAYPVSMLSSPLDVRQATLSFQPGAGTTATEGTARTPTVSGAPVASGGGFAALVRWRLTPIVLVLSLLLAFAFGALHALGPGHGKTITAAYLVGKGARVRQAVVAGVAVSFMHTVSVLTLGLVALVLFHSFPADRVYPWLGLLTGLVAVGLGTGLLIVRVRARRRGVENAHGHSHPWDHIERPVPQRELVLVGADGRTTELPRWESAAHLHHHPLDDVHESHGHNEAPERGITRKGLAALAVAGGVLPSPTALVVLTGAIAYHRLAYGLGLIVAFSLGLATALILVAMLALRARSLVTRRLGSRLGTAIPIASAVVIVGFGLFFLARGLTQVV